METCQKSKTEMPITMRQIEELAINLIDDAEEGDKAFMTQFVGTQMFNQYIEENCDVKIDDEMFDNM